MGRLGYGLVASAALAIGCASAAPPEQVQQSTVNDGGGGGASDFAGQACVEGSSCTTGNPGACNAGAVSCQGGVATCVPASTTQACYSGPPQTKNKGICKEGMQTCIGSLGSCGGEVLPMAVENCFNDLDDDCDGKVNNGCPDTLGTGTPRTLTMRGNGAGGSPFQLRCPAGSFITGTTVYGDGTDLYIAGLDIVCSKPTLVRGASSYSVTLATVTASPNTQRAANISTGVNFSFACGAGFTPGWWFPGVYDNNPGGIDRVGMQCASTALALSATNQLSVTMTKQGSADSAGYNGVGPVSFTDECAANEVLIGWDGRKGNWFDALAAVCAPLVATYK